MSRKASTRKATQKDIQDNIEVDTNMNVTNTSNNHNPTITTATTTKSPSATTTPPKSPTPTIQHTTNNPQPVPQPSLQLQPQLQIQQEDIKHQQHIQPSNYVSACQWAAQQSAYRTPQIVSTPPPKEPVRPKGERISATEIQGVQNYIEKCLQLYMNQNEVITALHLQANIEPGFTSLVWQKLEQQNPEFFNAYNLRLRVKEQITAFNYLASQQLQALQKSNSSYFQLPQHTTVPGNFFRPEAELGGMGQLYDLNSIHQNYGGNNSHDSSKEDTLDTNLFFDQTAGQTV